MEPTTHIRPWKRLPAYLALALLAGCFAIPFIWMVSS